MHSHSTAFKSSQQDRSTDTVKSQFLQRKEQSHESTQEAATQKTPQAISKVGFNFGAVPLENNIIQPKLKINAPNDRYEQEADRVADQVMRMSNVEVPQKGEQPQKIQQKSLAAQISPLIQRMPISREREEELKQTVQTKATGKVTQTASSSLSNRIQNSKGKGQLMDSKTNAFMSSRFGTDFSNVIIHNDHSAVHMNQEINARAFTVGNDIYFNQGMYDPSSEQGKRLLAHELVHVVQQKKLNRDNVNNIQKQGMPTLFSSDGKSIGSSADPITALLFSLLLSQIETAPQIAYKEKFKKEIDKLVPAISAKILTSFEEVLIFRLKNPGHNLYINISIEIHDLEKSINSGPLGNIGIKELKALKLLNIKFSRYNIHVNKKFKATKDHPRLDGSVWFDNWYTQTVSIPYNSLSSIKEFSSERKLQDIYAEFMYNLDPKSEKYKRFQKLFEKYIEKTKRIERRKAEKEKRRQEAIALRKRRALAELQRRQATRRQPTQHWNPVPPLSVKKVPEPIQALGPIPNTPAGDFQKMADVYEAQRDNLVAVAKFLISASRTGALTLKNYEKKYSAFKNRRDDWIHQLNDGIRIIKDKNPSGSWQALQRLIDLQSWLKAQDESRILYEIPRTPSKTKTTSKGLSAKVIVPSSPMIPLNGGAHIFLPLGTPVKILSGPTGNPPFILIMPFVNGSFGQSGYIGPHYIG